MPLLLATTVLLKVPDELPAVNTPDALIAQPPLTTVQLGEMETALPALSLPVAVKVTAPPMPTVAGLGETVMLASAPGCTVTEAKPATDPLAHFTVLENVPATLPAVN